MTKDFINIHLAPKTTTTTTTDKEIFTSLLQVLMDEALTRTHSPRWMNMGENVSLKLDTHPRSQGIHLDENVSHTF
jgi:hypothetical protein